MSSKKRGVAGHVRGKAPTSNISVRLTSDERKALSLKADQAQLALSAFIRACALSSLDESDGNNRIDGHSRPAITPPRAKNLSSTERTQIALVIACMGRLMDTIRAFEEEPVEEDDQALMLACLKREIRQTRDQCFIALRRTP